MTKPVSGIRKGYGYFNSHPHEEDDFYLCMCVTLTKYFNSHPHEEDDGNRTAGKTVSFISTHILTKRMTGLRKNLQRERKYFNSHPHEEDDNRQFFHVPRVKYFNSHPHEEDD